MKKVLVSVSKTDNGFSASCDLLPGWVVAFTGNFDEFVAYVKESIDFYVACAKEDGEEYPAIFDEDYSFIFRMNTQSLLLYYNKILSRAAIARLTGVNEKQLGHYLCGISKPREKQSEKIRKGIHKFAEELYNITM